MGDGHVIIPRTGASLLFHALRRQFPGNTESLMLRAGLEFFAFCPLRTESAQIICMRFDAMLDKANKLAELDISYPFRAWMLMALLRLLAKKWTEYLKEMGHRFPRTSHEYKSMQDAIVREKTLETQVGNLSQGGGMPGPSTMQTYLSGTACAANGGYQSHSACDECDWLPLYLCLGSPTETGTSQSTGGRSKTEHPETTLSPCSLWMLFRTRIATGVKKTHGLWRTPRTPTTMRSSRKCRIWPHLHRPTCPNSIGAKDWPTASTEQPRGNSDLDRNLGHGKSRNDLREEAHPRISSRT